jgi:prepilin peptidase CpaA
MITTLYLFILIQLTLVSIGDLRTRKIPNIWSLLNISFYILLLLLFPTTFEFHIESLILSGGFLVTGFVLFVCKVMGGGDAKYLSTSSLLIPYELLWLYLEYLLIATLLFASYFFLRNLFVNKKDIAHYLRSFYLKGVKNFFGTKFAYAPVILLAWILLGLDFFKIIDLIKVASQQ